MSNRVAVAAGLAALLAAAVHARGPTVGADGSSPAAGRRALTFQAPVQQRPAQPAGDQQPQVRQPQVQQPQGQQPQAQPPQAPQPQAQQPPNQQPAGQQPPRFRVAANFVRVDAYPTADGRPVTDLSAQDFEVFEDGKPQKIETFEHVVVRAAGPQETRVEPSNVEAARQAASEPRSRVFVLFLDTYHVTVESSHRMRLPLIKLLDGIIGQDDLVAVMTPEMSAGDLTFARRTTTIEGMLTRYWYWGRRERITGFDPEEDLYLACYPPDPSVPFEDTFAGQMIARRREKRTLDALRDLVTHLEGVREERKAILTISEGWKLFGEDRTLMNGSAPALPGIYVGPGGKPASGSDPRMALGGSKYECDRDRAMLAQIDDDRQFRLMLDEANRANASFYTIDPRGLPAFDTSLGPSAPLPPARDAQQLSTRLDSLRTLAGATDGVALLNSNDIEGGIRRVVEDLTSYYLLGYYSTNTKLDGKIRSINVRVRRPGVTVRARRGYRAPTAEEVAARAAAAESPANAPASPLVAALGSLASVRPEALFRLRAVPAWKEGAPPTGAIWVVGELDQKALQSADWSGGARAEIAVTGASGAPVASSQATLAVGGRSFQVVLPEQGGLDPGDYLVRVRVQPAAGSGLPLSDAVRIVVGRPSPANDGDRLGQPLLYRRGPSTGSAFQPTADPRYRRQERVRVEVPVVGAITSPEGRVLDRSGQPLPLTLTMSERQEAGVRWIVGEVALAPLAAGDYLIEMSGGIAAGTQKVLVAIKVIS
jgi:VWFA-related protein